MFAVTTGLVMILLVLAHQHRLVCTQGTGSAATLTKPTRLDFIGWY